MAPHQQQDSIDPRKPDATLVLDPVVERTLQEDPFIKFVQKRWRKLLVALCVVGAAAWFVHMFRETYHERMREGADAYASVETKYAQLRSLEQQMAAGVKPKEGQKQEDAAKELQTQIDQSRERLAFNVQTLVESESPYNLIGRIYQDLLERSRGNLTVLKADLAAATWASDKPGSEQRFYNELRALVVARALLDDPASRAQGLAVLKDLAARGETAYVSAGLAVARLASTPEEKTEAARILEGIVKRSPQQRDALQPELDRLNAAIGG